MVRLVDGRRAEVLAAREERREPRPIEELTDPRSRAMVRMFQHRHKAILFEQEELRLPNGDYKPDAPELLRAFWLKFGLYVLLEHTGAGNCMVVRHMRCVEDIS